MTIFQTGEFKLHSGEASNFKIECDALTDDDLETLARLISDKFDFQIVIGIPAGGEALAEKLIQYTNSESTNVLIVDDVLTTGSSMEKYHWQQSIGVVIYARGPCPEWITPVFSMEKWGNPIDK